jgi:hypothetical protein
MLASGTDTALKLAALQLNAHALLPDERARFCAAFLCFVSSFLLPR